MFCVISTRSIHTHTCVITNYLDICQHTTHTCLYAHKYVNTYTHTHTHTHWYVNTMYTYYTHAAISTQYTCLYVNTIVRDAESTHTHTLSLSPLFKGQVQG